MKLLITIIALTFALTVFGQYKIERYVMGNGGGKTTSAGFIINGTAGQNFTGSSSSAANRINAGFWYSYSQITGVKDDMLPQRYMLYQNYPNPFNPVTNIRYELPEESRVTLKIYNILGELQETLIDAIQGQGAYTLEWNANRYSSGFYICRIEAGKYVSVKKLILLK